MDFARSRAVIPTESKELEPNRLQLLFLFPLVDSILAQVTKKLPHYKKNHQNIFSTIEKCGYVFLNAPHFTFYIFYALCQDLTFTGHLAATTFHDGQERGQALLEYERVSAGAEAR